MALHVDEEGAPHIHMRRAWIYRDENGIESIAQSKTLQAAGIPLPHPEQPEDTIIQGGQETVYGTD